MRTRTVALLVFLTALGPARRAYGEETRNGAEEPQYTLDGQQLRITRTGTSTAVDLGCEGRSVLPHGNKLLIACGSAGVLQFDVTDPLSPRREGTMQVDGDASGLFLHEGKAWVEVSHVDAQPVRIGATISPPARTPPAGKVPVVWRPETRAPAHEDVPPADTEKEPPGIVAPPRQGGVWEMALWTGAFVTMGSLGAGVLGAASVAYRFEVPVVLRAEVTPFGVAGPAANPSTTPPVPFGVTTPPPPASSNNRAVSVFAAHFIAGLDTEFVEVGLGIGGASVNQNSTLGSGGQPATSALSVVEEGRLGARDGLAVIVETSAIAANDKFDLGYIVGAFQIPLSKPMMLIARGGGGRVGFGYGDLGVRVVVRGDGARGTLALTGFVGGAVIMENLCSANPDSPFNSVCNQATLAGPSLGGGVEWRL